MSRPIEMLSLEQHLDRQFGGMIKGIGRSADEARKNFLSKALAAYFLMVEAGATPADAVAASIDGGQDHGLDSIYISPTNLIWLVQSKYIEAGVGEPGLAECNSFEDGVRAFLNHRFDEFNEQLRVRIPQIKAAMDQGGAKVRFALVYTGGALNKDRVELFAALERSFNRQQSDFLRFMRYGLTSLHGALIDLMAPDAVNERLTLRDFGWLSQPHRAVYGRLSAKVLADLSARYGDQLVARNIRRFRGGTQVNDGIAQTLRQEAENLFYFNNGVTFLCDRLDQVGRRDETRSIGEFEFANLSIVNGAQTAGMVAAEPPAYYEAHPAEILATFICLEAAGEEFGARVTQYRNFQNAVQAQDFSALDEDQYRLKATLAMHGVTYLYKPGEGDPELGERVFSVDEAAKALACRIQSPEWGRLVVAAKREPDVLFDRKARGVDARGEHLPSIMRRVFPDSLTAVELWRAVQAVRLVHQALPNVAASEQDAKVLEAAVWLCSHIAFLKFKVHEGAELFLGDGDKETLSKWIERIGVALLDAVNSKPWDKEVVGLFDEVSDCNDLKGMIMAALPAKI